VPLRRIRDTFFDRSIAPTVRISSEGQPLRVCQKIKSVSTLLALALLIHVYIRWQVDDLYQFGSGELTGPARRKIFRIACDPQFRQSVPTSQRHEQPESPSGKMVASKFRSNSICDMTAVQAHVLGAADAEMNFSGSISAFRTHNVENVIRNPVLHGVCRLSRD
jgi:hypothetical protein